MKIVYIVLAMSCDITRTYLFELFTIIYLDFYIFLNRFSKLGFLFCVAFTNIQFYIIQDTHTWKNNFWIIERVIALLNCLPRVELIIDLVLKYMQGMRKRGRLRQSCRCTEHCTSF